MITSILSAYGFDLEKCMLQPFGAGLINQTWLLKYRDDSYIFQKINHSVFKNPADISYNLKETGSYLKLHFPGYLFVQPLATANGMDDIVHDGENYYRLFPFIRNSVTYTTLESSDMAYEASRQFGQFTHLLSGFDAKRLKETLPGFHNLTFRYSQFEQSLQNASKERLAEAEVDIQKIINNRYIVDEYEKIKRSEHFKKRVIHHDTKISNVLFDNKNKGLCVIDLDTVMPGYFISDVGDMMRTYLSPVSEEEKDLTKIEIREDFFEAVADGYLGKMRDDLTEVEKNNFVYAGKFMIYMQAVRFLADHLNNDVYYGIEYEGQNFVRAKNQLCLLDCLYQKEKLLLEMTKRYM